MSTYELDDEMVRQCLRNAGSLPQCLANALSMQLPLPTPTKLGAVVQTKEGVFVLADPEAELCWARPVGPQDSPDWMTTEQIGRITEVLSEGVDL